MKIIFVLLLLTHLSCTTDRKINQDCILLEDPKIKASCGIFSVWVGMKFKKKNGNNIFIGLVHCPEVYGRNFFAAGKVYEIIAEKLIEMPKAEVVYNEYINTGFPVYKIEIEDIKLK